MKLIYTSDGLHGWIMDGKMVWCSTRSELNAIGWAHIAKRKDEAEYAEFVEEIGYAIDTMTKRRHSAADFGIFGTFMYSYNEDDYEVA